VETVCSFKTWHNLLVSVINLSLRVIMNIKFIFKKVCYILFPISPT